jgi:hypothetical protein
VKMRNGRGQGKSRLNKGEIIEGREEKGRA